MRFVDHSVYDNWTVAVDGPNVSTVVDKLIRLAAKNTEYYASDICYDVESLQRHIADGKPITRYLAFRDGGISAFRNADEVNRSCIGDVVQWWKLTHEPNNGDDCRTMLIRQDFVR